MKLLSFMFWKRELKTNDDVKTSFFYTRNIASHHFEKAKSVFSTFLKQLLKFYKVHSSPENLKKVQAKKLVKSNKSKYFS